jgi:hypothetical protein|tara:strand:- start:781 stop:972 length:192 start_codon:yes stop_codon:yes gene_type:complete
MQIEQLSIEEYTNFLSYGNPEYYVDILSFSDQDNDSSSQEATWISTLDSTTYPGMTFGYIAVL